MALQTAGEFSVDVDQSAAFDFVSDPLRLAQCVPGCNDPREISPGRYSAVVTSKVAFITLTFKVIVEIVKIEPPAAIAAKITGDAIGLAGRVVATAGLQLEGAGGGRTAISYSTDVVLTGKLGGFGESVFRAKSAELAREFATNLKAAIEKEPRETHV
jgi:carbon monoxide dehydrogenase subunit G